MSITLWSGLPGSGKSYCVTRDVLLPAIQEGRTVYTNIPLHDEVWIAEHGYAPVHFETKDVIENKSWFLDVLPSGAVLVLDECWRLWPAGLKANNVEGSHKEFLAEHRHRVGEEGRSTEIVLVSQDAGQLSAFCRQLIEKTYRCKKLDAVGRDQNFRIDIYEGAVTGANPPADKRIREMFGKYEPAIFKFYKSHTKSETGTAGNEKKVDQSANIMKGGKVKAIVAGLVILPIVAGLLVWSTYRGYHQQLQNRPDSALSKNPADNKLAYELAKIQLEQSTGFLHGRQIVIAAVANYGRGVEYRFKVKDGDGVARFDQMQLMSMGYRVEPIGECAVRISGHADTLYALCVESSSAGVVAQAFQAPKETTPL